MKKKDLVSQELRLIENKIDEYYKGLHIVTESLPNAVWGYLSTCEVEAYKIKHQVIMEIRRNSGANSPQG